MKTLNYILVIILLVASILSIRQAESIEITKIPEINILYEQDLDLASLSMKLGLIGAKLEPVNVEGLSPEVSQFLGLSEKTISAYTVKLTDLFNMNSIWELRNILNSHKLKYGDEIKSWFDLAYTKTALFWAGITLLIISLVILTIIVAFKIIVHPSLNDQI